MYIFKMAKTAEVNKRHRDFPLFLNINFPNEENCNQNETQKYSYHFDFPLFSG